MTDSPCTERLAELEERSAGSSRRPSEIRAEANALGRELQLIAEHRADLFARFERGEDVEAELRKLGKTAESIERKLKTDDWEARILGAEQAARAAQSEIYDYVEAHLAQLLDEIEPLAHGATDKVNAAIEDLVTALADEAVIAGRVTQLLHVARKDDRRPLENPVNAVISELRRTQERMRPPLPRDGVNEVWKPEQVAA